MSEITRSALDKSTCKLLINSDSSLTQAKNDIDQLYLDHRYLVVSVRPGRDRSIEQQGLWWKMYERVEQKTFQGSAKEIWAFCKLLLGVPIMCRDDVGFAKGWERFFVNKSYEEQLYLMGANPLFGPNGFPVTSLFGTAQGREYTQSIADYYAPQNLDFSDLLADNKPTRKIRSKP